MCRLSLGRTTDVSLEHARERANELTSAARGGRDLIAEEDEAQRRPPRESPSALSSTFYLRQRVFGRLRTADSIERGLRRDLAPIVQRCAADISRRDIREILDAIADRGCMRELKSADRWWAQCSAGRCRRNCGGRSHRRVEGLRSRHAARSSLDR